MNVSFSGCGFLGLYHVGVASCFKTYAPQIYLHKVSGASAGAIAALALMADVPLGEMTSNILRIASEARARTLGPFSPSFNITQILYEGLNRILPDDIHKKVQDRLHVSLTKVYDGSNILVNQFANKEEVIQVVIASSFIPIFSGWLPPRYRGIRVIDGGYSDNLPVLNGQTITVSPFSGNSDICPQDDTAWKVFQVSVANTSIEISKENLYRLGNVLLPPDPEVLARVCKQGFEDALRYLQRRCLISCTRCLTIDSNYKIEDEEEYDNSMDMEKCINHNPNCLECKLKREVAKDSSVPESVWVVFENAINEAEQGFTSWIRLIPASRIIRLLTMPALLPINIASRLVRRLIGLLPRLSDDLKLQAAAERLIEQLCAYMTSSGYIVKHQHPEHHLARYTCEFNIIQYGDEEEEDTEQSRESVKDIFSMELTAELETNDEVDLPHNQAEAIKFQYENFNAAVSSHSRVTSRMNSRSPSHASSSAVSRMDSRRSSIASFCDLEEDSPVLETIRHVTQHQDSVMAFYYTDASNQVKITEIFDVTMTDPSALTDDHHHRYYSQTNLPSQLQVSDALSSFQDSMRRRHYSGLSDGHDHRSTPRGEFQRSFSQEESCPVETGVSSMRSINSTPLIMRKFSSYRVEESEDDLEPASGSSLEQKFRSSLEQISSSPESSNSDPESDWTRGTRLMNTPTGED